MRSSSLALLVVLTLATGAAAEPLRLRSPATCKTDGGSHVRLPPGLFLPEPDREILDVELRRLQEQETRLEAEKSSLLDSIEDSRWRIVVGVVSGALVGFALAKAI